MAVRKIVLLGEPKLRERSHEVNKNEINESRFKKLISDMIDTAKANKEKGFITAGLAAPQVGEQIRVFLILREGSTKERPEYDVYINPRLEFPSNEMIDSEESCLSTPHIGGIVKRYRQVKVSYLDEFGVAQRTKETDERAIFFQHENDHLDGILWVDRLTDTKTMRIY